MSTDPRDLAGHLRGLRLLQEEVVATLVAEIDQPHVVVCRDVVRRRTTFLGPFDDGLRALVAADAVSRSFRATHRPGSLVCRVVPFVPGVSVP